MTNDNKPSCGGRGVSGKLFIGEYGDVRYEFDPLERAMKNLGVTEITDENRRGIEKRALEYTKVGCYRADVGARLKYIMSQAGKVNPVDFDSLVDFVWGCRK